MDRTRNICGMKYLPGFILGVLLAACSADNDALSIPQEGDCPIGFSTTVEETQTRSNDLTTDGLLSTGIFAYYTGGNNWTTSNTPNFMYNQKVERTNSISPWTYSPVKYWPNNDADKLSFFAYAPYVNETAPGGSNPSFSGKTDSGYPTLTYTVPTAEADQTDLLASVPLMNQTYVGATGGSLKFTMKHALARVKFSVKAEIGIKVTALTVNNAPATAKLTFTDSGCSWGSYTGTKAYTATLASGGISVAANATDAQTLATFFLLPDKASATFSVSYIQDGETTVATKTNITFPAAWVQGGGMNFQLNVKKDGLSVTATVDQEWINSGEQAVTSNDAISG